MMPFKLNNPQVEAEASRFDVAEHNRQALRGVNVQLYLTLGVLVTLTVAFIAAAAFLVIGVVR